MRLLKCKYWFTSTDLLIAWQSICLYSSILKTKLLNCTCFFMHLWTWNISVTDNYTCLHDNINLSHFVYSQVFHCFLKIICILWYANILQSTDNNSNFQVCTFYLINDTVNGSWTLWVGRDCASTSSVEIFLFAAKIYLALLCIFHHAPFWSRWFAVSFYVRFFFLSDLLVQSLLFANSCRQFLHTTQFCLSIWNDNFEFYHWKKLFNISYLI